MDSKDVCTFYIKKKNRNCKLLVRPGNLYCGQHMTEDPRNQSELKRIPCPLDSKHTCYEHQLQKHLLCCNARDTITSLPYVQKNINSGSVEIIPNAASISRLTDDQLVKIIARVKAAHAEHAKEIQFEIFSHPILEEEMKTNGFGSNVIRHLTQNGSLLGHLQAMDLLNIKQPTCFIEFGAGRGQLTRWITEAVDKTDDVLFSLVDKGAQRYKFDAKLKYNPQLHLQRIRVDIEHLLLSGIPSLTHNHQIVAVGKHLCGAATDMAFRCICQESTRVCGVVLAICCHHCCSWGTYCGKDFLLQAGFSADDFHLLQTLTSWATCNAKDSVLEVAHNANFPASSSIEIGEQKLNRYTSLGLSVSSRECIGRKAKHLLDYGRLQFLKNNGFQCRLVQYVSTAETLENVAVIAHRV